MEMAGEALLIVMVAGGIIALAVGMTRWRLRDQRRYAAMVQDAEALGSMVARLVAVAEPPMREYVGRCTCGRIEVRLFSRLAPGQFQPRTDAPTCRFCSEHDGVWISDPNGTLRLRTADATSVRTFASEQVRFHFCSACNTLVHAGFEDASRAVAVVRLALFGSIRGAAQPTVITNFESETVAAGRQRRLAKWTPVQRS